MAEPSGTMIVEALVRKILHQEKGCTKAISMVQWRDAMVLLEVIPDDSLDPEHRYLAVQVITIHEQYYCKESWIKFRGFLLSQQPGSTLLLNRTALHIFETMRTEPRPKNSYWRKIAGLTYSNRSYWRRMAGFAAT
jgi:hypothetical protein